MDKDNESRIKDKVEFFMDEKIKVHVELLDKTFLNGFIIKKLKNGVYWLEEDKIGEVFLFLRDIYNVDKFKEKEEVQESGKGGDAPRIIQRC